MRSRAVLVALLLMACSVSAFDYSMGRVGQPNSELLAERLQVHLDILKGQGQTPYRYRVLAPLVIHAMTLPASRFVGYARAFQAASAGFYPCVLVLLLIVLEAYLEVWFSVDQALVGTLLVGGCSSASPGGYSPRTDSGARQSSSSTWAGWSPSTCRCISSGASGTKSAF